MREYTTEGLAERAGVDVEYVDRLATLGILKPSEDGSYMEGDARRVAIVRALQQAGSQLDGIASAVRSGDVSLDRFDDPLYDVFATLESETFGELAHRTGLPLGLLTVIREALGSARPGPDDRVRSDELRVVPLIELQLKHGYREVAIERWLRATGDALRRVAETEAADWVTAIRQPLVRQGKDPAEIGALTASLTTETIQLIERAILAIHLGQLSSVWMQGIVEGTERELAGAGLTSRAEHPPAICFLDLTGYTRLTEERGDQAAAGLAEDLVRTVQRTAVDHGGKVVKWLGDGVMFRFPEPGRGVLAALEMVAHVDDVGPLPAHVGLHAGPVLFQQGDYFGRTVNAASRIADYARPGEVLVSQEVADACTEAGVAFDEVGPVDLKGFSGALHLYVAHRLD